MGEFYEEAGNEQPFARSGVISAGEHPGLMQESLRSVKRRSVVRLRDAYVGVLSEQIPEKLALSCAAHC